MVQTVHMPDSFTWNGHCCIVAICIQYDCTRHKQHTAHTWRRHIFISYKYIYRVMLHYLHIYSIFMHSIWDSELNMTWRKRIELAKVSLWVCCAGAESNVDVVRCAREQHHNFIFKIDMRFCLSCVAHHLPSVQHHGFLHYLLFSERVQMHYDDTMEGRGRGWSATFETYIITIYMYEYYTHNSHAKYKNSIFLTAQ